MNRLYRFVLIAVCLCILPNIGPEAQAQKVLTSVYSVETGHEQAFDTYLSPLTHTGTHTGISGEWIRRDKSAPRGWQQSVLAEVCYGSLRNNAHTASMADLGINISYGWMYTFPLSRRWQLSAGAEVSADCGALYLPRNSNNPVAARASVMAVAKGQVAYSFDWLGRTWSVCDEVRVPSAGIFFSPHFGQSYYEISLGEDAGLVRAGWWGNHLCLDNRLSVDIPLGNIRMRVGYHLTAYNSRASDIRSHILRHGLSIGICTDWLNVTGKHD